MKVEDIKKVAVIGAGVMGHGIAQVFAQNGYEVFLYDISHDILQQALSRIQSNLDTLIEHGLSTEGVKQESVSRIEDIDTVVKGTFGFRLPTIGPFETADFGGLDTWFNLAQDLFPQIDRSTEPPRLLREKVEQGKLGVKTGEGFYKYDKALLEAKIRERDRQFIERLRQL